jgi:hypothetical protein
MRTVNPTGFLITQKVEAEIGLIPNFNSFSLEIEVPVGLLCSSSSSMRQSVINSVKARE